MQYTKPGNPHSALQILSAYVTGSGIVLAQEFIHEKANEIPVFQEMLTAGCTASGKPAADWTERKPALAAGGCPTVFSIERIVEVRGHSNQETSYYISSRDAPARQLMELAREHWLLDVTFPADDCRFLSENAHKTMNALRKFALAVHKNFLAAGRKRSFLKAGMLSAPLDSNRLLDLLRFFMKRA